MEENMRFILLLIWCISSNVVYAGATAWLPMEVQYGHVIVDIKVGGVEAKAMLDTGAESNAISKAFLNAHNIEHRKGREFILEGVYGKSRERLINKLKIDFQGSEFTMDGTMPFRGGGNFSMILGMPFFNSFVVQIDYPNEKYRLITHNSMKLNGSENLKLNRNRRKSRLTAPVLVNSTHKVDLLFDTGNSGGILLYRPLAESKGWLEKYAITKTKSSGIVTSGVDTDILVFPTVEFGPFTLDDVMASVPSKGNSKNLRPSDQDIRYKGILGYDMLKHFLVTLDAHNGLAHLMPSAVGEE